MRYLARTAIGLTLCTSSALFSQTPTQPAPQPSFSLDVVSIRPNNSGSRNFGGGFNATGLRMINMPIEVVIYQAYFPAFKGNLVVGYPAWTMNERYDIVGHIDEESAAAWLKLNPRQQQQLGKPMLQKLLADRCKLVAHLVPTQVDGYSLVVSKHGTHLTPAKPDETYPDGVKNLSPDGAKTLTTNDANGHIMTIRFFNTPIQELADLLGGMSGSVIQDQTNLSGRYDFTIRRLEIPKDPDGKPIVLDPLPSDLWDISATGLEFKHAKVPSQNLVIDHIEHPTPN
jgi:uncharacterized protein (TIGR03435 family)